MFFVGFSSEDSCYRVYPGLHSPKEEASPSCFALQEASDNSLKGLKAS